MIGALNLTLISDCTAKQVQADTPPKPPRPNPAFRASCRLIWKVLWGQCQAYG